MQYPVLDSQQMCRMRRKWGEKESYEHCWGFEAIAIEVSRFGSSGCLFDCKNACGVATLPGRRAR
jgi:hypothetical protein